MIVNQNGEGVRALEFHQRRFWRWAAFDPPMRHPGLGGCCKRKVLCNTCGQAVGTADDPIDALLIAWRHRRGERHRDR
jgi:hypothetical protein